jgi:hypothetical protein
VEVVIVRTENDNIKNRTSWKQPKVNCLDTHVKALKNTFSCVQCNY